MSEKLNWETISAVSWNSTTALVYHFTAASDINIGSSIE
jgi:hypothetical protein